MSAKFRIGQLSVTFGAEDAAKQEFGTITAAYSRLAMLLARHASGDWGDVNKHGQLMNDDALRSGARLFSVYEIRPGLEFWIITEPGRTKTKILVPQDY